MIIAVFNFSFLARISEMSSIQSFKTEAEYTSVNKRNNAFPISKEEEVAGVCVIVPVVVGSGLGDVALRSLSLVESCPFINDKSVD